MEDEEDEEEIEENGQDLATEQDGISGVNDYRFFRLPDYT